MLGGNGGKGRDRQRIVNRTSCGSEMRHSGDDERSTGQLASAAIIAAQAGVLVRGIVRTGRLVIGLMFVVRDARMPLMSVLRTYVSGNRSRRIRHRRSVFAKWHRHRAVALQRQPQRDQHRQDGSAAVHSLTIFHNIWLFQSSEPESGAKVPYYSTAGDNF